MPAKKFSLGPETDMKLESLADALEGKKVLDEPYVDPQTLLRAVREQNQIIRMMQLAFHKSEEKMAEMQQTITNQAETISHMQGQVGAFQDAVEKVEEMENHITTFKEKIVDLDETVLKVNRQEESLLTMNKTLEVQGTKFTEFKADITTNLETATTSLQTLTVANEKLEQQVVEMPGTINITSDQIAHKNNDGTEKPLNEVVDGFTQSVTTLESFKEETASTIEAQSGVMDKLDDQMVEDLLVMRVDFKGLMEWKEEQAGIDLVDIRRSQDGIKETLDTVQRELFEKIAKEDVDAKLESKFEEIIDHLQSALNSTESDEADFKAVTGNLNQMCESLKQDKADKTEIAALRKQFVQHQTNMLSEGGMGGEGFDPEELESMLADYPTKHHLEHELHKKVDKHAEFGVLERTLLTSRGW